MSKVCYERFSVGGSMNIDERIDNYTKMIEQEKNPVFKRLYELNRNLLKAKKDQTSR